MTKQQLDLIESQLDLKLPGFYRRFMRSFPVARLCGRAANGRRVDCWEFTNLPSRVIQLNRSVRRRGRKFDDEPSPHEFIVIGYREFHGYYMLNSVTGRRAVIEVSEDEGKGAVFAESLAEFAERIAALRQNAADENATTGSER